MYIGDIECKGHGTDGVYVNYGSSDIILVYTVFHTVVLVTVCIPIKINE